MPLAQRDAHGKGDAERRAEVLGAHVGAKLRCEKHRKEHTDQDEDGLHREEALREERLGRGAPSGGRRPRGTAQWTPPTSPAEQPLGATLLPMAKNADRVP